MKIYAWDTKNLTGLPTLKLGHHSQQFPAEA